jgi:type II secretory pathway component GspD/PulD (secretin)
MPFVMAVNANGERAQLNMGADVAIPNTTFTPIDTSKSQPIVSFNYRNIGTSIQCGAITTAEEGRFEVNISVDDSSVFLRDPAAAGATSGGGMPAFRSFKSRNTLLLRDGQTRQYTAATDSVSGETIRIDVTLRVVK